MRTKRLMGMILMSLMLLVSTVVGLEIPYFEFNKTTSEVIIQGDTVPLVDVNIVIEKNGKRYFLDTVKANEQGDYSFQTKLPGEQIFDTILAAGGEIIRFKLDTSIGEGPSSVDKSKLNQLIVEAEKKQEKDYTPETWKPFAKALAEAKEVQQNDKVSQNQVNQMINTLQQVMEQLKKIGGGGIGPVPTDQEVKLSIDKKTIGKGYVIAPTDVSFKEGETVWDVLQRELEQRGIDYDYSFSGEYGSVYIEAIDGDGEFDHGAGSGWMYNVNGIYPEYGCSLYKLKKGDRIEWRYTTNLGADLGPGASGGGLSNGNSIVIPNIPEVVINIPKENDKIFELNLTHNLDLVQSLTINIPESSSKVFLQLEGLKGNLPYIKVNTVPITLAIPKGTRITKGDMKLELTQVVTEQELNELRYYKVNEQETEFSVPVTLTLNKGKDLSVAWIKNSKVEPVVTAQVTGENLVVESKSLASFVTYRDKKVAYKDTEQIAPWAKDAVEAATQKGFISGYEGYFKPKEGVTRAEFTKMLLHVLYGDAIESAQAAPFEDVKANDWFKPYVDMAYEKGIIQGVNEAVRANDLITREQMASMMVRALKLEAKEQIPQIKDRNQIAKWAEKDVEIAYQYGLINGIDGKFKPKETTTREMAVVVIMRADQFILESK